MKLFEEVHLVPEDVEATCEVCKQPVSMGALVGFWDPEPEPLPTIFVEGLGDVPIPKEGILERGPSHAFICVGPCGHSSADTRGGVVVWMKARKQDSSP